MSALVKEELAARKEWRRLFHYNRPHYVVSGEMRGNAMATPQEKAREGFRRVYEQTYVLTGDSTIAMHAAVVMHPEALGRPDFSVDFDLPNGDKFSVVISYT